MTLRATAHAVSVLPETRTIAVAVSTSEPLPDSSLPAAELEMDLGPVASLPGAARVADAYELRLFDSETWELLDSYALGEHEWVMTMRPMRLRHEFAPPAPPAPGGHALGGGRAPSGSLSGSRWGGSCWRR